MGNAKSTIDPGEVVPYVGDGQPNVSPTVTAQPNTSRDRWRQLLPSIL